MATEVQVQAAPNPPLRKPWNVGSTLSIIVCLVVGMALMGVFTPTIMRLVIWIGTLILLALFLLVLGRGISGQWLGFLVDDRNKMSLARLQLVLWLLLIGSAYLTAALTNLHIVLFNANVRALSITIPTEILALFGVSAASLAGASTILSVKQYAPQQRVDYNNSPKEAQWYDMFKGDDATNCDYLDLSKVQMFVFTLILVIIYGIALGMMFSGVGDGVDSKTFAITAFPALSATMVTLLSISQAGYLAYKAIPRKANDAPPAQSTSGGQ